MKTWAVRIEHTSETETLIKVEKVSENYRPGGDVLAIDSTPAVLAVLRAADPGHAAQLAWDRAFMKFGEVYGRRPSSQQEPQVAKLTEMGDKDLEG